MVSLFRPARQGWRRFINRLQQRITRTRGSFFHRTCRWPRGNILRRPVDDPKLIFKSVHERFHAPPCEDPPNGQTDGHHCHILVRPQVSSFIVQLVLRFVWFDSPYSRLSLLRFAGRGSFGRIIVEFFFLLSFSPHFFLRGAISHWSTYARRHWWAVQLLR